MSFNDWFFKMLWPEQYWFLCAIAVFYALFYWFGKYSEKILLLSIVLLGVPYFAYYILVLDLSHFSIESGYFKWVVYFQIMLMGAWLSKQPSNTNTAIDGAGMVFCIVAFFGLKIWLNIAQLWALQFLLHLILFPFALFAFRFFTAQNVVLFFRSIGLYPIAVFLAGLTLEIYLVQVPLVPNIAHQGWKFPIGWLVAIVLIPVFAYTAKKVTRHSLAIFMETPNKSTLHRGD